MQPEPDANITDLHAFIVDKLVGEGGQTIEGEHLIVSLCVRRALTPEQDEAMRKAMEPVYKEAASRVGQPLIDEFLKESKSTTN